MKKPLVSDMTQADFFDLFVNCIKKDDLNDFVRKKDIENFCTRNEIEMIAEKASEHSTKKIEAAIKTSIPEAFNDSLTKLGFTPEKPQEMQELIIGMKRLNNTIEKGKNNFQSSAIRVVTTCTIGLIMSGVVVYISKAAGLIR